jgi:tetratricopeptide (TPR) repeat protein
VIAEKREALLHAAKQASRERRYEEVDRILSSVPVTEILEELDLCLTLGVALTYLMRHDEAKSLLESARSSCVQSGDAAVIRRWQNIYSIQLIVSGDLAQAMELLSHCAASAESVGHFRMVAVASNGLGMIAGIRGEADAAVSFFLRSLAGWQHLGDRVGVAKAHHNVGVVLREWGRLHEAAQHFALAEDYFAVAGTKEEQAFTTAERAMLKSSLGDDQLAESLARSALRRAQLLQNDILICHSAKVLGAVLRQRGQLIEAKLWLDTAKEVVVTLSHRQLKAEVFEELAVLAACQGQEDEVTIYSNVAVENYRDIGAIRQLGRFVSRLQSIAEKQNSYASFHRHLNRGADAGE